MIAKLSWVVIFGAVGVSCRFFINQLFPRETVGFPTATMSINLLGCFLIGIAYVVSVEKAFVSNEIATAILSGFLGGFTTFSALGLESSLLFQGGRVGLAAIYVFASVVGGMGLTLLGLWIGRLTL
jgi:fluoride exporter